MSEPNGTSAASTLTPTENGSTSANVADATASGASDTASTAREGIKDVAGEAATQAKVVAGEAKRRSATSSTRPVRSCRSRPTTAPARPPVGCARCRIRSTALADGRPGDAGPLAGYLDEAHARVSSIADRLDEGGPQGLLDDVTAFARRRPIVFLAAAGRRRLHRRAAGPGRTSRPAGRRRAGRRRAWPSADSRAVAGHRRRPGHRAAGPDAPRLRPRRSRPVVAHGAVTDEHHPDLRPGDPAEAARGLARRAAVGDDVRPQHAVPQGGRAGQDRGQGRGRPGRQGRGDARRRRPGRRGWPSSCSPSRWPGCSTRGSTRRCRSPSSGSLWAIAAAVLVTAGRRKLADLKTLPQTTETIKEDVAWAKAQTS